MASVDEGCPAEVGTELAAPAYGPLVCSYDNPTDFDVILTEVGPNRMLVLAKLRSLFNYTLREANQKIQNLPVVLEVQAHKGLASHLKECLEMVGAKVTLEPYPDW